jgi:hypothetical protein
MKIDAEYCMKCTYSKHNMVGMKKCKTVDAMVDEKEDEEKEEKHIHNEIRFITQIFSVDLKGYQHVVDLQITQGHPLAFFNLSHKIYRSIETLCLTH